MYLHIAKTAEEFNHSIADWMVQCVVDTLKIQNSFTLFLSGGNTPKGLYELL